jgi:hypothetical protein
MHLAQQGFSDIAILDFDLAVNDFGDEFERALNATKMVPAKKAKRRPMVPEALYDDVQLKRFLSFPDDIIGIRPDDDPELNTLVDDLLTGKADWLLPELPKPNVPE